MARKRVGADLSYWIDVVQFEVGSVDGRHVGLQRLRPIVTPFTDLNRRRT